MESASTMMAIAEAAANEFISRGYSGASLSAIAKRLGLTKGALTYHFRAKADYATHFIAVVRYATTQADEFAKTEYPDNGARRLLLYFLLMRSWRLSNAQHAAGMAMFTDRAAPTFEADDVIQDWLALSVDALDACRPTKSDVNSLSTLDAAEMFLITNLGAAFFGRYVREDDTAMKPLRFVRLALTAVGVPNADEHADEVLERYGDSVPALRYPSANAT